MRTIATYVARIAWSVCLSVNVLGTWVRCTKTAESTEMLFGRQTYVGPRNYVLDGDPDSPCMGRYTFVGIRAGHCNMPTRANVPARRTRRTNAFAAARGGKTAMRSFAKFFRTFAIIMWLSEIDAHYVHMHKSVQVDRWSEGLQVSWNSRWTANHDCGGSLNLIGCLATRVVVCLLLMPHTCRCRWCHC